MMNDDMLFGFIKWVVGILVVVGIVGTLFS